MPNYGVPQTAGVLTAIQPGDIFFLFNAETPVAPQASVAFATGYAPGGGDPAPVVFTISFAAANPVDQVVIQGSNVDKDSEYQTLYTSNNLQHDFYADVGGFAYYRAKLVSQSAGGAITAIAKR